MFPFSTLVLTDMGSSWLIFHLGLVAGWIAVVIFHVQFQFMGSRGSTSVHIPRMESSNKWGIFPQIFGLKIGCYKHRPAFSSKFPCSENGRTWRLPVFTARKPLEFTEQRPEFRCADYIASSSSGVSCRETPPWLGENVAGRLRDLSEVIFSNNMHNIL